MYARPLYVCYNYLSHMIVEQLFSRLAFDISAFTRIYYSFFFTREIFVIAFFSFSVIDSNRESWPAKSVLYCIYDSDIIQIINMVYRNDNTALQKSLLPFSHAFLLPYTCLIMYILKLLQSFVYNLSSAICVIYFTSNRLFLFCIKIIEIFKSIRQETAFSKVALNKPLVVCPWSTPTDVFLRVSQVKPAQSTEHTATTLARARIPIYTYMYTWRIYRSSRGRATLRERKRSSCTLAPVVVKWRRRTSRRRGSDCGPIPSRKIARSSGRSRPGRRLLIVVLYTIDFIK